VNGARPGAYLPIRRRWSGNDTIELNFDMSTQQLRANPAVVEDRGRIAFQRGPIVFCMEMLDQPDKTRDAEIVGYTAHLDASTTPRYAPDLLDGVMVLEHPGSVAKGAADTSLYFTVGNNQTIAETPTTLRLIPYYAWANRAPSSMQVWIPFRVG
jgi:DUF1680 family protein